MTIFPKPLADVQNEAPAIPLPIQRVGVSGLHVALELPSPPQTTTARAALAVSLAADRRGTHMSRLVEVLSAWRQPLSTASLENLLRDLRASLRTESASAAFSFICLAPRTAPARGGSAPLAYPCHVRASLDNDKFSCVTGIRAPVMTVCPCSLAISSFGAHSQRAEVRLDATAPRLQNIMELIGVAESAGSSPVYPLLKREDEKAVTEQAFANAAFVEDVARRAASGLAALPDATAWKAEVESMESIHGHNAFARIASPGWRNDDMDGI